MGSSPFERCAALLDYWASADPTSRTFAIEFMREPLRGVASALGYQPTWVDLFVTAASKIDVLVGHAPAPQRNAAPAASAAPSAAPAAAPPPPFTPPPPPWQWQPPGGRAAAPPPPPPPPPRQAPSWQPDDFWRQLEDLLRQFSETVGAATPPGGRSQLMAAFAVVGVAESSSWTEVKRAYRARARDLHPDLNKKPGAKEGFQALQEAFSVLEKAKDAGHFKGRE